MANFAETSNSPQTGEIREQKFQNLAHRVLEHVGDDTKKKAKATKHGTYWVAGENKFGDHRAHKNQSRKIKGGGKAKGEQFLETALKR